MCNERDRLIAYIYDECDATERDAVRQHLDGCDECRVAVRGLRSVREDLLAWDVPAHGSVWQPFAPAKPAAWWRQVPAWALAAAASLVLLSGAAGGAMAHAFVGEPAQGPVVTARDGASPERVSLTADDLAALERRLSARFSDQVGAVDARVQQVSSHAIPANFTQNQDALMSEVLVLRETNKRLNDQLSTFLANQDIIEKRMDMKFGVYQGKLDNMQANMQDIVSKLIK